MKRKQMMDLSDARGSFKTSTMLVLVEQRSMEIQFWVAGNRFEGTFHTGLQPSFACPQEHKATLVFC
jgi:hypothetical protein